MSLHHVIMSLITQTVRTLLTKCHFIRLDCLLWPLKELALFWPNVTSLGQIVSYGHSKSLPSSDQMSLHQVIMSVDHPNSSHSSDQMSLHQTRLSFMATLRVCTLLTKCHSIRQDWYGHSNCSYSSDQMLLHQAILPVMAAQTARTLLTKCHSIRPDCYGHSESLHSAN